MLAAGGGNHAAGVDDAVPRYILVLRGSHHMERPAYHARRARIAGKRRNLPIGRHVPPRDKRHDAVHALKEVHTLYINIQCQTR